MTATDFVILSRQLFNLTFTLAGKQKLQWNIYLLINLEVVDPRILYFTWAWIFTKIYTNSSKDNENIQME